MKFSSDMPSESRLPTDETRVECYAGHRADVSPRWVHLRGKRLGVRRIITEEIHSSPDGWTLHRKFWALLEDGSRVFLTFNEADGRWFRSNG